MINIMHFPIYIYIYVCCIKNGPCKKASFSRKKAIFYKLNGCKNTAFLKNINIFL